MRISRCSGTTGTLNSPEERRHKRRTVTMIETSKEFIMKSELDTNLTHI